MMQKMMTTVVDPMVSFRDGKETFFNSPLTSLRNSETAWVIRLNTVFPRSRPLQTNQPAKQPAPHVRMAGAPGIEPGPSVLETDMLAVKHHAPSQGYRQWAMGSRVKDSSSSSHSLWPIAYCPSLFHFFMCRMLSTEAAVLPALEPVRVILLVFHGGIIPPLTVTAGQRDNLAHLKLRSRKAIGDGLWAIGPGPPYCLLPLAHCQRDHRVYAMISVTTPEPTVLPPSRTANRNP